MFLPAAVILSCIFSVLFTSLALRDRHATNQKKRNVPVGPDKKNPNRIYSKTGEQGCFQKTSRRGIFHNGMPFIYQGIPLYFTSLPGFTSFSGLITASFPSKFSAERIIPSDVIPFNFRGARLAIKQICLPTNSSGA